MQFLEDGIFRGYIPPESLSAAHELLVTKAGAWRAHMQSQASQQCHEQPEDGEPLAYVRPAADDQAQGEEGPMIDFAMLPILQWQSSKMHLHASLQQFVSLLASKNDQQPLVLLVP